jgi:hypothetical protein
VRIYNNIIRYTGWDGIQVSSASNDCQLYDNIVMYDSQEGFYNQMSGIIIGGGSKCDCYNNFISHGKGNGIESHGLGGFSIYNNIIEEAGRTYLPLDSSEMRHGMYIANDALPDSSFTILFNNIIRPKSDGIRFDNTSGKNNLIASNVIIDPGNYDFYENGATSHSGEDAYVMLPEIPIDILVTNNYFRRNIDSAMFDTTGYSPVQGSPLIDAGYFDNNSIAFDLYHRPRLHGSTYDIGAVEYDPKYQGVNENPSGGKYRLLLFPNPVEDSFSLQFSLSKGEEVVIDIYALQGKRIYHSTLGKLDKGVHNQVVDTRLFEPGLYLFQLKITGQVLSGRFIKGKK